MTDSRLLIETFYFKQLLNEEVAFFNEYEPLLGDRTQEFFEHYRNGLNAQKELILALECVEISEKILQEKFGDQFAARVAGLGSKATTLVGKLATGAGLGGKLGNWAQNKLDINVDKDGSVAYINARNKNFTRSLGDYLGQLKTFDNTIPDKIGLVPVQKSGWLKGIAQKGGQVLKGGSSLALAGVGLPGAALIGTAFAGANGVQQLTNKLNEVFDVQWKKIQNTQPVQDFDRLFEEKKQSLRNKLSKTDKEGKETSKILQSVDALAEYAKKNPGKSGVIIALMTTTIGLSAGTLGLGILTATQLPILTGAVAFFLRTGLGLLKGESASTAVGGALKAAAVGWITGKLISTVVGPIFDNMIKVPQPAILQPDVINKVTDATGKGWVHEKLKLYTNYQQHMVGGVTNKGTIFQGFSGKSFSSGQSIDMDIVTTPENAAYIKSMSDNINKLSDDAWNVFRSGDQAGAETIINKIPQQLSEIKKVIIQIANDPNNTKLVNAFKNYDAVMAANNDAQAATKAFNDIYLGVTQGAASGVAGAAGGAIGAGASVGASGKPPVIKESFKLSDIVKSVMSEAEAAAPGAVPPVLPGNPPVNPDKLSGNQQDAVANLKKNIDKEIRGYIKDVAKTFKVKGKTTTDLSSLTAVTAPPFNFRLSVDFAFR
jgi:NADH:ubiquinone oxidoreductase subunit 6 (subunit J)